MITLRCLKRKTDSGNFILQQLVDGEWVNVPCDEDPVKEEKVKEPMSKDRLIDPEFAESLLADLNKINEILVGAKTTPRPAQQEKKLWEVLKQDQIDSGWDTVLKDEPYQVIAQAAKARIISQLPSIEEIYKELSSEDSRNVAMAVRELVIERIEET